MRRKQDRRRAWITAGALLLSGVWIGSAGAGALYHPITAQASEGYELPTLADLTPEQETLAETGNEESQQASAVSGLPDVSDVVEQCEPAVVSITNLIEVTTTSGFDWFFGQEPQTTTEESPAYGSGVIIGQNEEELLIVTNNHVAVYDGSESTGFYQYTGSSKGLTVTFVDGSEHEANLKGADAEADLAVIAVPLEDISDETRAKIRVATIGNSDGAKPGQGVIAIGNAMGLGQTTTIGYISALNRDVTTDDGYTRSLMQVDAAINKGNSGGGLFNGRGELIGINSAKYMSVGVEGIGYAIPISSAADIIDQLKEQKTKVSLSAEERGYLGIVGEDVSSLRITGYGYPAGAQIVQITPGSPAEESGLQLGDIITAVNGETVSDYSTFRNILGYYAPGETVELTVQRTAGRQFEELTIEVTLTSRDHVVQ